MEHTILLSKVVGIYLGAMGVMMMVRKNHFMALVNILPEASLVRFVLGLVMFVASAFLLVTHQVWDSFTTGFITFLGWAMMVKALLYMNLTNEGMRKWVNKVNIPGRYIWGGPLAILIGLYFLNYGFGWGI